MFRWLYILGALVLAVFLGGVLYFAQREADVWHEASGRTDGRGMPAVFDGFMERWNRSVERELLRELAGGERKKSLLSVSRGDGDGRRLAEQERSVERTYRWAQRCVAEHKRLTEERVGKPYQALYGVVQGANYEDLRRHAAEQIASLDFDGVGIGGAIEKRIIGDTCAWICDAMPESRPRHVLGIAAVDDIFACVENGGDTFDCVAPARCGRNGAIFTRGGRYNIKRAQFKHDFGPLEEGCDCYTCTHYSRASVDDALSARDFNGFTLATIHNEHFFVKLLDDIRASIDGGYFDEFRDETLARFYANGSRG